MLRPFRPEDAPELERLVSAREVAAGTLSIPHPYPQGKAGEWIRSLPDGSVQFAIERLEDGALLGSIGLDLEPDHRRAELGYLIGVPYWGHGYATEAARAVLRYGFEQLCLNRIYAYHFANNPASGRVMQRLDMTYEGRRRAHTLKWGEFLDNEGYGMLASEWLELARTSTGARPS